MRHLNRKNLQKLSPTMLLLPFDCLMIFHQLQEAEKNRPEMKVSNVSLSYGKLRHLTGVLLCLCLILLLTGCVRTETRYVQVPPVAIPSELTADCPVPRVPNPLTWGGSLDLNEHLLTAIENCNSDKAAIREIEASRQGKTQFSQVLEQKMKKASI